MVKSFSLDIGRPVKIKSDRAYYLPSDIVENAYCQYKELLFDNV